MSQSYLMAIVKRRREDAGLSQKHLAAAAGMSEKTYGRCERGESELRLSHFHALIRALNVTLLDIYLDMKRIEPVTAEDIASASRMLSPNGRKLLLDFILEEFEGRKKKPRSK